MMLIFDTADQFLFARTVIAGTLGNDRIRGTAGNDHIYGGPMTRAGSSHEQTETTSSSVG